MLALLSKQVVLATAEFMTTSEEKMTEKATISTAWYGAMGRGVSKGYNQLALCCLSKPVALAIALDS